MRLWITWLDNVYAGVYLYGMKNTTDTNIQQWTIALSCGDTRIVRAVDEDELPVWAPCERHGPDQDVVDFVEVR